MKTKFDLKTSGESTPHNVERPLATDLLLLPDGRILAHNLTPAFAEILRSLNPIDEEIVSREIVSPAPAVNVGQASSVSTPENSNEIADRQDACPTLP